MAGGAGAPISRPSHDDSGAHQDHWGPHLPMLRACNWHGFAAGGSPRKGSAAKHYPKRFAGQMTRHCSRKHRHFVTEPQHHSTCLSACLPSSTHEHPFWRRVHKTFKLRGIPSRVPPLYSCLPIVLAASWGTPWIQQATADVPVLLQPTAPGTPAGAPQLQYAQLRHLHGRAQAGSCRGGTASACYCDAEVAASVHLPPTTGSLPAQPVAGASQTWPAAGPAMALLLLAARRGLAKAASAWALARSAAVRAAQWEAASKASMPSRWRRVAGWVRG